ncbi:MAG: hypothetical protein ACTSPI_08525 [Candidatus Heimdallarchaeaceae archaeon]
MKTLKISPLQQREMDKDFLNDIYRHWNHLPFLRLFLGIKPNKVINFYKDYDGNIVFEYE